MTRAELMAIEAVVYLAGRFNDDGWLAVQQNEICDAIGSPRRYIEPVMQRLSKAGIIYGRRGPRGGYTFSGQRDLTLVEILDAVKSSLNVESRSPVGEFIGDVQNAVYASVTLDALLRAGAEA
jgi:Rrf2 family transcriptional regulator, iron-sulfur cluster assembly transcription factor